MAATVRAVFPTTPLSTSATTSATTTVTTSVTVVSGDVLEAHVTVSAGSDAGMTLSATANGVAATGSSSIVHSNGQTAGFEQVFYWTAPATGTYNVVTTISGGTPDAMGQKVYAIAGADAAAPAISTFAPSGTGNNTAATITSPTMPTGSVGISHFCAGSSFSSTGQTTTLDDDIGGSSGATAMAGAQAAGSGGTINFTATISSADWYAAIVTVWAQAGGGGGATGDSPNQINGPWTRVPPGAFARGGRRLAPWSDMSDRPSGPTPVSTTRSTTWNVKAQVSATRATTWNVNGPEWFTEIGGSTPELVVSAEDWGLLANATLNHGGVAADTFDDYFTSRAAQGYNAVEVSLFGYASLSNNSSPEGGDSDGVFPFSSTTNPSTSINSTWWARRDAFFASAASHGFRVFLNLTTPNLGSGCFCSSWTNTQWTDLGDKLAARYPSGGSYDHVFWIVADDYFFTEDAGLNALLTALRAGGANQPISIQWYQEATSRQNIFTGSGADGAGNNWVAGAQYNWGYSYNVSYDVVEKAGLEANTIPYGWMDGIFLNSGVTGLTDKQMLRRMVWWALSSGAKAFQVGDNNMWTWPSTALAEVTSNTFYTTVMPAIVGYFQTLPNWHLLKADTSNLLVTAGRGTHTTAIASGGGGTPYTDNSDAYVTASYIQSGAHAGKLAVIYMSHGSTITIDQSKMVGGYTATWVDPKSGATSSATPGTTYNSTAKGSNSDGQADWVLVLKESTTTPVSTTRATTWDVLAPVSTTRATTWDVRTVVTATRATTWDVLSQVSTTRATTWKVRAQVAASRATTWDVLAGVTATRATTWDVLTPVSTTRATTWDVLTPVSTTRATTWDVLAPVAATRATTWRVLAKVTATRATTWDVLTPVSATRATTWRVLAPVSTTRATTWNVASTLASVSTTRSTTWRVLATVTSSKVASWDVRTVVTSSRVTSWDVLTSLAATRATTWDVLAPVAATRATTWDTRAVVTGTRATTWRVLAQVAATRATTWNVLATGSVSATRSTTWRVLAKVTATRAVSWDVNAGVTTTRVTTWRVLGSASTARSTTWRVRSTTTAVRVTIWDTRRTVTATRATTWNVVFGLGVPGLFRIVAADVWYPTVSAVLTSEPPAVGILEAQVVIPAAKGDLA